MVTYDNFKNFFLVKNGMPITEENLNKAPDQLKKEVDEIVVTIGTIGTIGTIQEFETALG